jgi:hypothetical protein
MDWIASSLTFLGNIILIKTKHWFTFVIFFVGNSLWAYYWFSKKEYAALILVSFFLIQNLWGIYEWKKK